MFNFGKRKPYIDQKLQRSIERREEDYPADLTRHAELALGQAKQFHADWFDTFPKYEDDPVYEMDEILGHLQH